MEGSIKKLHKLWTDALVDAGESYAVVGEKIDSTAEDVHKFKLREYSEHQKENWANSKSIVLYENDAQLLQFVDDALHGINLNKKIYLGIVNKNLAEKIRRITGLDVEGFNCVLRASEVRKIIDKHGSEKREALRGQRAIKETDFLSIANVIEHHDTIKKSEKLFEGKPVINFTKDIDGVISVAAYVSSKHLDLTVQTMFSGKKKGNLATAAGEQAPANTPKANVSTVPTNSIRKAAGKSQEKFSEHDSSGKTLTKAQQEYFKNSKVLDDKGNLKVMYRGDSSDFTVFDRKKSKYSNLYGRGFYFTDSKTHAGQYGAAREFYLDIQNPLLPGQNTITKAQMLTFLEAIEANDEDYDLYNYGENATAKTVLESVWGKGDFEMLQDISASAIGDLVAAVELFNDVNGTNYDGIVLPTETVTFSSEQAKLTTNENPTKDKDIRFSERAYSYNELVKKSDMKLTIVSGVTPKNRADVVAEAKKNAAKVGKFNIKAGTASVYVDDIARNVVLSKHGLVHGLDRRLDINGLVTTKAGEILKNSIKINELTPAKTNIADSYVLIGAAKDTKDSVYIVRSIVNTYSNELTSMDVLYAINAKKESAVLNAPAFTENPLRITDSTISISTLLDLVNEYFPDVLPEDVLRHYGHTERPGGKVGESALFSDRPASAVSDRVKLANALKSAVSNEAELMRVNEYIDKIGKMDEQEKTLNELNAEIKRISFAKGPRDSKWLTSLQIEATKTKNRIDLYDKQLLKLESTASLKRVLEHEKVKAYKKAQEKGKQKLQDYKAAMKQKEADFAAEKQKIRDRYNERLAKKDSKNSLKNLRNTY